MDEQANTEQQAVAVEERRGKLLYGSGAVAMATLFGYIITYRYETGYAARFGVPAEYVDVTLVAVLGCIGSLLFSLYILGAAVNWILTRDWVRDHRIGLGLTIRLFAYAFVLLFFSALVTFSAKQAFPWVYLASLLGLVVIEIVIPARKHPDVKGWLKKIDAYRQVERNKVRENKVMDALERIFGFEMILVFAVGMALCYPAPMIGGVNATSQREFAVAVIDKKEYALIRRYDDHYLFERLSRSKEGTVLCASVLTMTSSELAVGRVVVLKETLEEPPRVIPGCK